MTHYHELLTQVAAEGEGEGKVQCAYMNHLVEHGGAQGRGRGRVTCLYKVREGACGSSFSFAVALKAGLPADSVERAKRLSRQQGNGQGSNE